MLNGVHAAMVAAAVAIALAIPADAKQLQPEGIVVLPQACDSLATLVEIAAMPLQPNTPNPRLAVLMQTKCFAIKPGTGLRVLSRNGDFVEIQLLSTQGDYWRVIGTFWAFSSNVDRWLWR